SELGAPIGAPFPSTDLLEGGAPHVPARKGTEGAPRHRFCGAAERWLISSAGCLTGESDYEQPALPAGPRSGGLVSMSLFACSFLVLTSSQALSDAEGPPCRRCNCGRSDKPWCRPSCRIRSRTTLRCACASPPAASAAPICTWSMANCRTQNCRSFPDTKL